MALKKVSDRIDKDKLKMNIIEKYGSQREFGKTLGLTEDAISKKMKTLSNGFIKEISEHVEVPYIDGNVFINNKAGGDNVGRDKKGDSGQVAVLEFKIKSLERELKDKNKIIELLEKQLSKG
jgi:hypothetical protein